MDVIIKHKDSITDGHHCTYTFKAFGFPWEIVRISACLSWDSHSAFNRNLAAADSNTCAVSINTVVTILAATICLPRATGATCYPVCSRSLSQKTTSKQCFIFSIPSKLVVCRWWIRQTRNAALMNTVLQTQSIFRKSCSKENFTRRLILEILVFEAHSTTEDKHNRWFRKDQLNVGTLLPIRWTTSAWACMSSLLHQLILLLVKKLNIVGMET